MLVTTNIAAIHVENTNQILVAFNCNLPTLFLEFIATFLFAGSATNRDSTKDLAWNRGGLIKTQMTDIIPNDTEQLPKARRERERDIEKTEGR